jgi:thiol-disulfide isomerase/thioredoxin
MKKFLSLIAGIMFCSVLAAQTPLTTAVDFTVTDIEGHSFNLFNKLNSNKYVCIDFFYTTCGPCQLTAPKVSGAYTNFGCNGGNVFFIGIDNGDNNAQVAAFDATYNAIYPSVSGTEGGGDAVNTAYGINNYPTVILIAPNKNIVEQDIWPISDAAGLTTVITGFGGVTQTCAAGLEENDIIRVAYIFPNPVKEQFTFSYAMEENDGNTFFEMYDMMGKKVFSEKITDLRNNLKVSTISFGSGIYISKLINSKGVIQTDKIIVL